MYMAGFGGLRYSDLIRMILEAAQERCAAELTAANGIAVAAVLNGNGHANGNGNGNGHSNGNGNGHTNGNGKTAGNYISIGGNGNGNGNGHEKAKAGVANASEN
jgi:hypothetical protein